MFIYNMKINGSKVFKTFFILMIILLILMVGIVILKIFNGASNSEASNSCLPKNSINKIEAKNYSNILKTVHENIDNYVGTKINFTGYVYRVLDLNDNQFVLARDMIISSDFQSVIVGFLCECDTAKNYMNDTWVEITGQIYKGSYNGPMPIVSVTQINETKKPNDEYVYPPDESYIPTAGIV